MGRNAQLLFTGVLLGTSGPSRDANAGGGTLAAVPTPGRLRLMFRSILRSRRARSAEVLLLIRPTPWTPGPIGPRPTDAIVDAIDLLSAANRGARRPEVEARLVRLRHLAFAELDRRTEVTVWPPVHPDLFPEVSGRPRSAVTSSAPRVLGSALVNHGALHVRGLLDPEQLGPHHRRDRPGLRRPGRVGARPIGRRRPVVRARSSCPTAPS